MYSIEIPNALYAPLQEIYLAVFFLVEVEGKENALSSQVKVVSEYSTF